jgi:hypothetical protein
MKFTPWMACLAVIALGMSLSAFARDNNSGNFTVNDTVQVGSTQLAPGDYKAEWSGSADNLKINIMQGHKTVATADGKIKNLQKPAPYDAVLTKTMGNNTEALSEIDFNHRTEALQIGGE